MSCIYSQVGGGCLGCHELSNLGNGTYAEGKLHRLGHG
jgi:hypothetical protein